MTTEIQMVTRAKVDIVDMLPAELSIVVPTFNEVANVRFVVDAVASALPDVRWEIIFVDDSSPDGTAAKVRELALADPRLRILERFGRRGLSSACVEGILASAAPYVAVMDSDLQHDENILGEMLASLKRSDVDIVVGSRYVDGGGTGQWDRGRVLVSRIATWLSGTLARVQINDPMSGFFMLKRDVFAQALPHLSTVGFKILLDLAASSPTPLRVVEVPYTFRARQHGESKIDSLVVWEYLQLLLDKMFGRFVPVRFISFALVGGFGVLIHFLILITMFKGLGQSFALSQGLATVVAITNNFFLNNILTYRDQRLKGFDLVKGWISFNLVCATGAAANIGVADWLFEKKTYWALSAMVGVLVSVVWNYTVSSIFTWRRR